MAIDPATRSSRRTVLKAALGGAAAAAAGALAAPLAAQAANDDPVLVGNSYTGSTVTSFENTDAGETSLAGVHSADGTGVAGSSASGAGVAGSSATGVGVFGASTDATPTDDFTVESHKTGVVGNAGATTPATNTDETGVYGTADVSDSSTGVWGDSPSGTGIAGTGFTGVIGFGDWGVLAEGDSAGLVAYNESNVAVFGTAWNFPAMPEGGQIGVLGAGPHTGVGVYGFAGDGEPPAPPDGIGVYAKALGNGETALYVAGKARFSRSGKIAVASTATVKKVTMSGVTSSSYVIATMQTSVSGLYVRAVTCGTGYFNIWLSKAPGKTVYVGYLVVN